MTQMMANDPGGHATTAMISYISISSFLLVFLSFRHSKYELTGGIKTISISQLRAAAAFTDAQSRDRL